MTWPFSRSQTPNIAAVQIIGLFLVLRLIFAATTGFGVDESYTIGQARFFSLSYLDHPPLHVWIAGAVEAIAGPRWVVRLPSILLFCGTGWFLYRLTCRLYDEAAGLWALAALNLSPFFFASPGTWVVPDGPFLFFAVLAAFLMTRLFWVGANEEPQPWTNWLMLGACLGLAALSKYLAIFIGFSLVVFVLATPRLRPWLRRSEPYCGALVALVLLVPVLIWNGQHDLASFRFQGSRSVGASGLRPGVLIGMVLGQFVWLGPWLACLLYALWRRPPSGVDGAGRFLLFLSVPPIALLTLQAFWSGNALPHWTMGGWIFVLPMLGGWLAGTSVTDRFRQRWFWGSFSAIAALVLVFSVEANTAILRRLIPSIPAKADPALDLFDWTPLVPELKAMGAAKGGRAVVALKWLEGGKIDLVAGRTMDVFVAGDDPRHFAFRPIPANLKDVLIVATRATFQAELLQMSAYFDEIGDTKSVFIGRAGLPEIEIILAPAKGYKPSAGR